MIVTSVAVKCDGCGWWDERTQASNRNEAIAKARRAGWTVGKVATCTACQGRIVNPGVAP